MKKVLLLGVDGLDPFLCKRWIEKGKLPALAGLEKQGTFRKLETTHPAQSPVAWASMATGNNPAHHGLFDFITRDPKTYLPRLSILHINPYASWVGRDKWFYPVVQGIPFWRKTSQEGIPTTVIKWPVTFPPEKILGTMLSGLGVPDLKCSLGRYTILTTHQQGDLDSGIHPIGTSSSEKSDSLKGELLFLLPGQQYLSVTIRGPEPFKTTLQITLHISEKEVIISSKSAGVREGFFILKVGQWSSWFPLVFSAPLRKSLHAQVKFYLKSIEPDLNLYMTSLHLDPRYPSVPLSYPEEYAPWLASQIGPYHTLGMSEETNGVIDNFLSEEAFLSFVDTLIQEREAMFWQAFHSFKEGVLAFVFDTIDRIQHIFWWTQDAEHPLFDCKRFEKYSSLILDYYQKLDRFINLLLSQLSPDTTFFLVSDHGFNSFRKAVHLNSFLIQNGFLKLVDGADGLPLFKNVDWKQTQAYAVGFSSLYLNQAGRESQGTILDGKAIEATRDKLIRALKTWTDPETREPIVEQVYDTRTLYSGPCLNQAPDLILGLRPGYRISWQTALGAAPVSLLEINDKKWTGDHIVDAQFVPGTFFSNRFLDQEKISVYDIASYILSNWFEK